MGKHGIAKPSNFAVNITPPAQINSQFISDLPFLVSGSNLPSFAFQVDEVRHKGYGLSEKRPVQATFDDLSLNIIGDAAGRVLEFFQKWYLLIHNFDGESENSAFGVPSESFNYPVDYWGTVELYLYDITSKKYHTMKFNKAYPLVIGQTSLGWEMNDQFMNIPIGFTYRSPSTSVSDKLISTITNINSRVDSNIRSTISIDRLLFNPTVEVYRQRFLAV